MLNQHEVKAHNAKVALKIENKKVENLENAHADAARRAKQLDAKIKAGKVLPMCKPEDRAPRKIYMGAKSVGTRSHTVNSAMPTPIERIAHVNGVILSPSRVPQSAICMDKVKAYLAK